MQNHFENAHSLTVAKEIAILLAFEGIQVAKLIKPFSAGYSRTTALFRCKICNVCLYVVCTHKYLFRSKKSKHKKIRHAIDCVHVASLGVVHKLRLEEGVGR